MASIIYAFDGLDLDGEDKFIAGYVCNSPLKV